jgi:WD40 repeat protein
VIAVRANNVFLVIDPQTGRELCRMQHSQPFAEAAFSPDARTLATWCGDGSVYLWNVATGQEFARIETRPATLAEVQFSNDGRRLAVITFQSQGWSPPIAFPSGENFPENQRYAAQLFLWEGAEGP